MHLCENEYNNEIHENNNVSFLFLKGNNNRSVTNVTKHNGYKALVTNLVENETFLIIFWLGDERFEL